MLLRQTFGPLRVTFMAKPMPAAKSVWHRGANQLIRQSVLPQEGIEMAQIKFGYQIDFRNPPASGRSGATNERGAAIQGRRVRAKRSEGLERRS